MHTSTDELRDYDTWSDDHMDEATARIELWLHDDGVELVWDILDATNVAAFLRLRARVIDELVTHIGSTHGRRDLRERRA